MHRFYVKDEIPGSRIFILESAGIARQMRDVLKMKKGEAVVFFNGTGFDFEAKIERLSERFVSVKIIGVKENHSDPETEIHLYQSLIKKNKWEWILEKGTEVGVKFFHPVISSRTVKKDFNHERVERILREATEQSGQDKIPVVAEVVKFKEALVQAGDSGQNIIFDKSGVAPSTADLSGKRLNLFVGPEGGFTEKELEEAKDAGFSIVSLGPRILRSETAAVVATALTF